VKAQRRPPQRRVIDVVRVNPRNPHAGRARQLLNIELFRAIGAPEQHKVGRQKIVSRNAER